MIRYKDKIFPEYFIDPVTAIITNSKGEVQEVKINKKGRPCFNCMEIHRIQVHTYLGYKKDYDIHHLDENKMNNSLSNLVYLTSSEHAKLHMKGNKNMFGKHHSEETKRRMSGVAKGRTLSEETKLKMRESHKGKNTWSANLIWINNGVISKMVKCNEEIPTGFIRGRLKKMNDAFVKFCYKGFKKNDAKFPDNWTLKDYKKYTEECDRILERK